MKVMVFDRNEIKKILVVRFGAFGDVLMTFPLLEALREIFPGAVVDYAVFDGFKPLLETALQPPRRVIVLKRSEWPRMNPLRLLLDQLGYVRQVRRERYDLLIDPLSNTRSFFLALFSRARFRLGIRHGVRGIAYHLAMREVERKYGAEVPLDLLRALGLEVPSSRPRLKVPAAEQGFAADYFRRERLEKREVVLLHATGSWPSKVWPAEHFAAVAKGLAAAERTVLVFWGPGEKEGAQKVADISAGACRLLPQTTILQGAAIIERCKLMVTNDTGPKHIAQALGVPTVCVYGPTWRECWGPGGERNVEIQREVDCGPCDKTECEDPHCMHGVKPAEVLEAARGLLAGFGRKGARKKTGE